MFQEDAFNQDFNARRESTVTSRCRCIRYIAVAVLREAGGLDQLEIKLPEEVRVVVSVLAGSAIRTSHCG